MDISTLATAALTAALPYLTKGSEQIAQNAGKDLWELIKKPFTKETDRALVKNIEENPDDLKTQGKVEQKLIDLWNEHPELIASIQEKLNNLPDQVKQRVINNVGNNNIAIADVANSHIVIRK